jgi:hypothetical protein
MKGGDMDEKDGDRIWINGSDGLYRKRIWSRPKQRAVKGSDKNHLSDRNPGPDSHPGPAKEPNPGSDTDPRSIKGWFWQDKEITNTTLK